MRILVVANLYPSERNPAFGAFVQTHVDAMRHAGHVIDVVAITDDRVHFRVVRKYVSLTFRATFRALTQRLLGRRYALIEAHIAIPTGAAAMPASFVGSCPLVVYAHGSDVARIGPRSRVTRALSRLILGRATLVIANSTFTRDCVNALSPTRRPVAVISPGIRQSRGDAVATERKGILFVGRLTREKGVAALIRAVGMLEPPIPSLTIVGDGPDREQLERAARDAGVPASFVGAVHPTKVEDWYRRAEVVVVPSQVAEGLGLAALEAMANGAVVVATRMGALAEIVDDRANGFLVDARSPNSLRDGIQAAFDAIDSGKAAAMIAAARATASEHGAERCAAATIEAYEAVVRKA